MRKTDGIRLHHMLEAAQEAGGFLHGKSRADLASDRMLALALARSLEIIGEAASKMSTETRAAHPNIPWTQIIGMRNRLVHAYFDIDLDRVWDTVFDDLPALITALEAILDNMPEP